MSTSSSSWFTVDREGLRKLLDDRPKLFLLCELISNAWDENSTEVELTFEMIEGTRGRARLICKDNNPEGFKDLTHAYTMFAASGKKGDAQKRGRFNLGEKLVLALCECAEITTTTGHVKFLANGQRETDKLKTLTGSVFSALVKITKPEYLEACRAIKTLIPPAHIKTTFNGEELAVRQPVCTFHSILPTMIADDEGVLRRSNRKAEVRVYEPLEGETPMIYELGIPVVELDGDRYHVDVLQKVPLTQERDNVPPSYLRTLRTAVLNATYDALGKEDASQVWVDHAMTAPDIRPEAVQAVVTARFGDKVVSYSPSDPEANKRAMDEGYKIVYGSSFSKEGWENVREAGAIQASTKLFGTHNDLDGTVDSIGQGSIDVPREQWTPAMQAVVDMMRSVGSQVVEAPVSVKIVRGPAFSTVLADYHPLTKELRLNLTRLGEHFFRPDGLSYQLDVMIHELAHDRVTDHMSASYYHQTTRIGGLVAALALQEPALFRDRRSLHGQSQEARTGKGPDVFGDLALRAAQA